MPRPASRRSRVAKDVRDTARVAALMALAWLPERWWDPVMRAVVGRAIGRPPSSNANKTPQCPAAALSAGARAGGRARRVEAHTQAWLERLPALRMYRPGGWRPRIHLAGTEHLEAALSGGHGAILWVSEFRYHSLATKIALASEGYKVSHLSRPIHGFSMSPYGRRRLNPLRTNVEDRFLGERVRMAEGATVAAMRTLRRRLTEGGVVSITVGREASQTVEVPFFDGLLQVATGPVSLAASSGAPLLPLHTLRRPDGAFEVLVEEPLPIERTGGRVDPGPTAAAYARCLERWSSRYPGQWTGWIRRVWRPAESTVAAPATASR